MAGQAGYDDEEVHSMVHLFCVKTLTVSEMNKKRCTVRCTSSLFAQHERILTGASPQTALIVGRSQPKARVSLARGDLKEAVGKQLARCTRTRYEAGKQVAMLR